MHCDGRMERGSKESEERTGGSFVFIGWIASWTGVLGRTLSSVARKHNSGVLIRISQLPSVHRRGGFKLSDHMTSPRRWIPLP